MPGYPIKPLFFRLLGLTLVELITVLAITSLLLFAAAPPFGEYTARQRIRATTDALHQDMAQARSASVMREYDIVVCPGTVGAGCRQDRDWSKGWFSFEDINADRHHGPNEAILTESPPAPLLAITSSTGRNTIRFKPSGTAPGSNATITLCQPGIAVPARQLRVSNSGRIRQTDAADEISKACQ